jgi:hypothetical protein
MAALAIVLLILALIFGIGAVVKGVLWVLLVAAVLLVIGVYVGVRKVRQAL